MAIIGIAFKCFADMHHWQGAKHVVNMVIALGLPA
jgi:hypothetical protein